MVTNRYLLMKTLFKLFLGLFLLVIILMGAAYFVVTRPAFQKSLIEDKLPPGSSLKHIQVTTGNVELQELKLLLEDGTTLKIGSMSSGFSTLAAVFDRTIRLQGLELDGLLVELPESAAPSEAPAEEPVLDRGTTEAPAVEAEPAAKDDAKSPAEALYALGQIDWLFDIDSIHLNGVFIDPARNRYALSIDSNKIAPGAESEMEATLSLESSEAMQGGLKDFSSELRIQFTQNPDGGFEKINIGSQTQGSDAAGAKLLSANQSLDLTVDAFAETAQLTVSFDADLPRPEVFAPELAALQGLTLQGDLNASAVGEALTLANVDLLAATNGRIAASVKLKQSLTLGAQQKVSGDLMDVELINLPLAWINPWLGDGLFLSGAPLSARIAVSGQSDGGLQVVSRQPIEIGPISMKKGEYPLLDNVTIRMNPVFHVDADGNFSYDLGEFELLDRYGDIVVGTVSGTKTEAEGSSPLAGLQTKARLQLGLAEVYSQPALRGKASVLAGQATVHLDIDGAAEYPAQLQAAVTGLRARGMPGSRQDYRMAAQLKQSPSGSYALGANLEAGSENRATTSMQLAGQVNPEKQPLPFKVSLTSSKITQSDLELLAAAFEPNEAAQMQPPSPVYETTPDRTRKNTSQGTTAVSSRPPWADLDGDIAIKIDSLLLASGQTITHLTANAKVSEPELIVDNIQAGLDEGRLTGDAKVLYNSKSETAYHIASNLSLQNLDPAAFSKKRSRSFPVQGLFDGQFNFEGHGATLEEAADASQGELTITGRDGVLTAFDLNNRSQLGLIGVGILGQTLDRPGVTAMSQAIPYFKDMRFEDFTLKLTRGEDKQVRIPELSFIGDNLRINGEGFIAASSLGDILDQPLTLSLGLGAKGRLIDYLETLQLLGPNTSEDGFRDWKSEINIGGTLDDPDTSALQKILTDAAYRAINEPEPKKTEQASTPAAGQDQMVLPGQGQAQAVESTEPPEKSKEEQIIDDIEMGLDLFNAVLGN